MNLIKNIFLKQEKQERMIGVIVLKGNAQVIIQDSLGRQHRVFLPSESSVKVGDNVVVVNNVVIGLSHEESEISVYNV